MAKDIRVGIAGARSSAVGSEHGVTPAELKEAGALVQDAHRKLQSGRRSGRLGFFDLYRDKAANSSVESVSTASSKFRYDNLVVLGIGGSALGTTALATALLPPYYNLLTKEERGGRPRLFVMDNVDPSTFAQMLDLCPPEKTLFNVISKSGDTGETLAQALVVLDRLEKALGRAAVKEHVVVTTGGSRHGGNSSPLAQLISTYKLKRLKVPENVGGRFSVFSPVGMFAAAMLGMDLRALRAGCGSMDRRCRRASLDDNPAYLRAALHYVLCARKGKGISVMMPYSDSLRDVADWYRQLWAESLGKGRNLQGKQVSSGQTPINALGVTDQHSQLQLYLEGPNDKIITVLEEGRFGRNVPLPKPAAGIQGLNYLRGASMNALMAAERRATMDALRKSSRPVAKISLDCVDEHTVGQLLYLLQVETAMAGVLFNVNAFDQPAVEQIKGLTRKYMESKR